MMLENKPQLVVQKEYSLLRIGLFLFLLLGVGAGVVGVLVLRDTRSKAAVPAVIPSPLVVVRPSPVTNLTPPYVRLVIAKKKFGLSETIPVDVYLDTKGNQTVETDIYLTYDPKLIAIDDTSVVSADVFKTVSVDATTKGKLTLTLFNTPQVGHPAVVAESEVKIATLNFKGQTVENKEVKVAIDFKKGDAKKTLLVPYAVVRPEIVESILESVEGVTFEIGS